MQKLIAKLNRLLRILCIYYLQKVVSRTKVIIVRLVLLIVIYVIFEKNKSKCLGKSKHLNVTINGAMPTS